MTTGLGPAQFRLAIFLLFFGLAISPLHAQEKSLKIGMLIPDRSDIRISEAANLALTKINERGGFEGRPFELVIRTTEGPWGMGSKESVALVYEDSVLAILGWLDGRNAHLAEQVAAKSHLVYLETRATDPTLSQAYVPWFFRMVPNDVQQSEAIYDRIKQDPGTIAILATDSYDARYAIQSMTKCIKSHQQASPLILKLESGKNNLSYITEQIHAKDVQHLILPVFSHETGKIASLARQKNPDLRLYGMLDFTAGLEQSRTKGKEWKDIELVSSYESGSDNRALKQAGGISAAYVYDGMTLLLETILRAGPDKEAIKDQLYRMKHAHGLSGPVVFDEMGNRQGNIRIMKGIDLEVQD